MRTTKKLVESKAIGPISTLAISKIFVSTYPINISSELLKIFKHIC
jgi:hypothetical protein